MGQLESLSQNGLDSTAIVMGVAGKQLSVVMALASALCINNSVNPAATALNTKPLKTVAQSILNKSMTTNCALTALADIVVGAVANAG